MDTLGNILQLAGRGTVSLRHNGDECVVLFAWPPAESRRRQVKAFGDSWNDAINNAIEQVAAIATAAEAEALSGGEE